MAADSFRAITAVSGWTVDYVRQRQRLFSLGWKFLHGMRSQQRAVIQMAGDGRRSGRPWKRATVRRRRICCEWLESEGGTPFSRTV